MKQYLKGLSAFCLLVVFLTATIVTAPVKAATPIPKIDYIRSHFDRERNK